MREKTGSPINSDSSSARKIKRAINIDEIVGQTISCEIENGIATDATIENAINQHGICIPEIVGNIRNAQIKNASIDDLILSGELIQAIIEVIGSDGAISSETINGGRIIKSRIQGGNMIESEIDANAIT